MNFRDLSHAAVFTSWSKWAHLEASDPLTAWFLALIVGVFATAAALLLIPLWLRSRTVWRLVHRCRRLTNAREAAGQETRAAILGLLNEKRWLKPAVADFDRTWRGAYLKSHEAAVGELRFADFIHPHHVLPGVANRHMAGVVPGVLVALGILGTFLGLVSGLPALGEPGLPEEQFGELVSQVTKSLSLAFWTSIFGIGGSVLFLLFDRWFVQRLEHGVIELGAAVGAVFPTISRDELARLELGVIENGVDTLRHLSTDLAANLANVIAPAFSQAIHTEMAPLIGTLKSSVESLAAVSSEAHVTAMREIVDGVVGSMNTAMSDQIDRLGVALGSTVETQQSLHKELEAFQERLQVVAESQVKVLEGTTRTSEALNTTIARLEQVAGPLSAAASQTAVAADRLVGAAESATKAQEAANVAQAELLAATEQQSRELIVARDALTEAWTAALENARGAIRQIQEATRELGDKIGDQLVLALEKFDKAVAETIERFDGTLVRVDASIQELPPAAANVRDGVVHLNEGVQTLSQTIGRIESVVTGLLSENIDHAARAASELRTTTENASVVLRGMADVEQTLASMGAEITGGVSALREVGNRSTAVAEELAALRPLIEPLEGHLGRISTAVNGNFAERLLSQIRESRGSEAGSKDSSPDRESRRILGIFRR